MCRDTIMTSLNFIIYTVRYKNGAFLQKYSSFPQLLPSCLSFGGSCGPATLGIFKLTTGSAVMGSGEGRDGELGTECVGQGGGSPLRKLRSLLLAQCVLYSCEPDVPKSWSLDTLPGSVCVCVRGWS